MSVAAWTQVPLGDVATPVDRAEVPAAGKRYRQIGVRLWGEGAYERESMDGAATQYGYLNRVEPDDIIVNKIWARHGAVSVVTPELADCWCSGEFPLFTADHSRLRSRWMYWLTKSPSFWTGCEDVSRGTTSKSRLRPEQFLRVRIPLPSPDEQDRIVATLDAAAARVAEAQRLCREIDEEADALLRSAFHRIADDASRVPMSQAAPVHRRLVEVNVLEEYPQVALKSFGKGTFHRPPFRGSAITWQKPFRVRAGDLLFCNTNAWEGAVGVALPEDDNHCGSHRYVTFVPNLSVATPEFVLFYLLTAAGMRHLQHASPGTTVRNRTMNIAMVMDIPVPVPPIEQQHWFNQLQAKLKSARAETARIVAEAEAMLPAILDRAFKGELVGDEAASVVAAAASTPAVWRIADMAAIQTEIVRREKDNPTLGRKKLYKAGYLTAALVGARLEPAPKQMAAGPFNAEAQDAVEQLAKQEGWFAYMGRSNGDDPSGHYKPLSSVNAGAAEAKILLGGRWTAFSTLMTALAGWDSDKAELIATTHAAWNDLLAAGETITDAAVIARFYDWSHEKAKFAETAIKGAMGTLRSLGLEPTGGGPLFVGAGEARLFGSPA